MSTFVSTMKYALCSLLLVAAVTAPAMAQVPSTIGFQGLLTDENGVPLPTDDYSLSFRIYNLEEGGTALWTEVQSVSVVDGIANATLGRVNPLELEFDNQYYLGITVGQNPTELSPRLRMHSSAYAHNARSVQDGAIVEAKIADGAVASDKIADNAVTSAKIGDGQVLRQKINTQGANPGQTLVFNDGELNWGAPSGDGVIGEVAAGAGLEGGGTEGIVTLSVEEAGINREMIRDGAVNEDKIANNAVTTSTIAPEAVTNQKIPAGEIGLSKLSINGADEGEVIVFNGTAPQWRPNVVADEAVTTAKIADGAVTGPKIFTSGATEGEVLTYNGTNIVWSSVPGVEPGSIGTNQIADEAVTTAKLANQAVGADQIDAQAVTAGKIADAAVTAPKIFTTGAVNGDVLSFDGANVVWDTPSSSIGPGSVGTTELADQAVTTAKIADDAVDTDQLADDAVDTGNLAASAVTNGKLANNAVNLSKIDGSEGSDNQVLTSSGGVAIWADAGGVGPGSITETELADNAVSADKIKTGAVTSGKIFDGAVGNAALANGSVDNVKIAPATIALGKIDLSGSSDGDFLGVSSSALTWIDPFAGNVTISGDLNVTGALSKGSGTFKIDHPLDPENKYLYHSFVESDEMMNVYSGNVELDADGKAVVELPEWFEAANRDYRYQLTCIGGYAPVYIERQIEDNSFSIAGGSDGLTVSWQITAVRDDALARHRPVRAVVDKPEAERGSYLHPEAFK